jgi:hypothetical protein
MSGDGTQEPACSGELHQRRCTGFGRERRGYVCAFAAACGAVQPDRQIGKMRDAFCGDARDVIAAHEMSSCSEESPAHIQPVARGNDRDQETDQAENSQDLQRLVVIGSFGNARKNPSDRSDHRIISKRVLIDDGLSHWPLNWFTMRETFCR